jgi:hypothetical protein
MREISSVGTGEEIAAVRIHSQAELSRGAARSPPKHNAATIAGDIERIA